MNNKKLVNLFLDIGEEMLASGGEVNRVEDTLSRLAKAYGAQKVDIFVITSSIVLTVTFSDDEQYTISRRILSDSSTDFVRIERFNALSRLCCESPLSIEELQEKIEQIKNAKPHFIKAYIGSAFAAGSFAFFFGGSIFDALLAALFGIVACFLSTYLPRIIKNKAMFYLIVSLFIGTLICLCWFIFPSISIDKISIGVIMLLIPGIATVNSMRDMLIGDTISGSLRLIHSLIIALMLAGGFMMSLLITGADANHFSSANGYIQLVPALLGSMGFALVFNLDLKHLALASLGGLLGWLIYLLCEGALALNVFWASLIAAFCADLFSQISARITRTPTTLFLISAIIPLVPGSSLYYTASALVLNNGQFAHYGLTTVLVVLAMALGVGISSSIFALLPNLRKK